MGERRDLAALALSLLHDDATPAEGIDSTELAEGQAYLNGFVVQVLADAMHVSVEEALAHLRRLLGEGGGEAGVREPRRPHPSLPALAVERDHDDQQ